VKSFDWQRLLMGDAPWSFLLEVLLRLLIVYLVLVVVVRLLGKRLSGRVGNLELGVMLALGAIVAVPIQDPVRGVLPGLVLLVCLLGLQRGLSALGARHATIERATQNSASLLVADGVLALEQLKNARVSVGELFSVLRNQGLSQLGQARRVYLEAYGQFSILRQEPARAGLALTPGWDRSQAASLEKAPGVLACSNCGALGHGDSEAVCPRCQARAWVPAVAGG
jgi:uncharacterized membrane protein YcaP (DUF421 family)